MKKLASVIVFSAALGCGSTAQIGQDGDALRNVQAQLRVASCNWDQPSTPSCCSSCWGSNCQANGCYGGWWCDPNACVCGSPPSNCGGGTGGGTGGGSSCVHPICSSGSKLTASCDPCAGAICAQDSYCCNNKWDAQCVGEVASICGQSCSGGGGGGVDAGCSPSCTGKECGDDGCGGSCGSCASGQSCDGSGQCVNSCTPSCAGLQCGSDGCGGSCGTCAVGQSCDASGQCVSSCTPTCAGKQCGSDGCGGSCGTCAAGQTCGASGQCQTASSGSVGPNGGTVSSLYFAVVGDTRPGGIDATSSYPTPIITQIYKDLQGMSPAPQFVVTTGDYMFASTTGTQAQPQMDLYMQAASQFTRGPIFSAMGNHECTGATATNCTSLTETPNIQAYMNAMVTPLGKSLPYYSIPINASDGSWTAKVLITACNYWNSAQQSWLQNQLNTPTTYTFVVRHEDAVATTGPCVSAMDSMLSGAKYDLLIDGHSHQFANKATSSVKEIIVGNGGAPLTGSYNYGFVTVQQQSSGGFLVTDYDYQSMAALASFTVP